MPDAFDDFLAHLNHTFERKDEFEHPSFEHDCAIAFEDMMHADSIMKVYRQLYMHDNLFLRNTVRLTSEVIAKHLLFSLPVRRHSSAATY